MPGTKDFDGQIATENGKGYKKKMPKMFLRVTELNNIVLGDIQR